MKFGDDGSILLDIISSLSALIEGNTKFDENMKILLENFSFNAFLRITWHILYRTSFY